MRVWEREPCGLGETTKPVDDSQDSLSLSLSPYEAYLIIMTMILSSFTEHIYSALVARANCGVSSPSPCQYLLSLLWRRRGWPRLSTAGGGERQRSTESFIFLIHLRAFPRLASSGQHKPVLWAANQATAHEDDWDALAKFLYLCKEEDGCCGLLNYRYSSCGCSTRQKKKSLLNETSLKSATISGCWNPSLITRLLIIFMIH